MLQPMTRRQFLATSGGAALSLHAEPAPLPARKPPAFPAKAKSLILLITQGGMSQMDTFDPKPALERYDGKTLTPEILLDEQPNPLFLPNRSYSESSPPGASTGPEVT